MSKQLIEKNITLESNEKNGKKYVWEIVVKNDTIDINIIDKYNQNLTYQKKFSKSELDTSNKNFLLFKDMNSLALEIEKGLINKTYDFHENTNNITISFIMDNKNQIDLIIPLKENGENDILLKLKKLEKENEDLKKENQILKKENEELKKKLNIENAKEEKNIKEEKNVKEEKYNLSSPIENIASAQKQQLGKNFNQEKFERWVNEVYNKIVCNGLNPKDVDYLFNELDKEFNLTSIIDVNEIVDNLIEKRCDREKMNEWIFEKL